MTLIFRRKTSQSIIMSPADPVVKAKQRSILKKIPHEAFFDTLKFLTHEQWFPLQTSNSRLAGIINRNLNHLSFPSIYYIDFVRHKYGTMLFPDQLTPTFQAISHKLVSNFC
jgi:hypothetical protein